MELQDLSVVREQYLYLVRWGKYATNVHLIALWQVLPIYILFFLEGNNLYIYQKSTPRVFLEGNYELHKKVPKEGLKQGTNIYRYYTFAYQFYGIPCILQKIKFTPKEEETKTVHPN